MEQLINCIAVDDEEHALRIIENFAAQTGFLNLQGSFRNPLQATKWLEQNEASLIFLDIQMPQQSGMDMFKALKKKPVVVFTTAYSDFAAEAFDVDAADYLLKPFAYQRFLRAANKARDILNALMGPASNMEPGAADNFITVKSEGKLVKIPFSEIIYAEAYQEYIKLFTPGKLYIVYERMKNLEALLPTEMFMRVHRSYIVSLANIKSIAGNLLEVAGHHIPVSRDLKDEILKRVF
ncbi:MAG TPA: LytTR family DNA-binding domain-containing protein, partial [Chitinophagales bacterium]|nr:LytTR family DNA-binding domain-containing protein [Chitinophagales bacterium]